jgi:hypothetical protein
MVAVEEKNIRTNLSSEPLFYYKEFSLCKTRRYNSFLTQATFKHKKIAVDRDIKHPNSLFLVK